MKKILFVVALSLVLIGFTGFIGGALISSSVIEYNKELPLGDINGFVVDKSGRIYVLLGFYGKVQVYNSDGQFIRNWHAGTSGKVVRIDLSEEQNILIGTTWASGDKQTAYDSNGNILSEKAIENIYDNPHPSDTFITDQEKYEVRGIFPKIVSTAPSEKVIVEQGLLLNIMRVPISWIIGAMGMGSLFLLFKYYNRNSKNIL